jgi:hypothetical protein
MDSRMDLKSPSPSCLPTPGSNAKIKSSVELACTAGLRPGGARSWLFQDYSFLFG